jgi:hypothetical protein
MTTPEGISQMKEKIDLACAAIAPHLIDALSKAKLNAERLLAAEYDLKHNGKEYLQNMPDPRCLERLLWSNVYSSTTNAALLNPNVDGTPEQVSKDASMYADLAVEAYQKRFPNV